MIHEQKKMIGLNVSRDKVLDEVAQKSGYTGAKMPGEADMLDNIQTVDEDSGELVMFFDECRAELADALGDMLAYEGYREGGEQHQYGIDAIVPARYNEAKNEAVSIMLFNYFVYGVLARWYEYTNKEEAAAYALKASMYLDKIKSNTNSKIFRRKIHPF